MRFRRSVLALPCLLLLLSACRDPEVRAYRVPKEKLPEPPPAAGKASPHAPAAAGAALAWQAPTHWQEREASGFRRGSFTVPGSEGAEADLSIIAFPGQAGGLVENLNRWRGQLELPAATESELSSDMAHIDVKSGLHFDVVDFVGTANGAPTRIVGAVVEFGGQSWFFKLMGPDALVASEKRAFLDFLQSVTPAAP